jgi:hypothetical protein
MPKAGDDPKPTATTVSLATVAALADTMENDVELLSAILELRKQIRFAARVIRAMSQHFSPSDVLTLQPGD